jgi:uncharacterized protein (TIGR00369 family)
MTQDAAALQQEWLAAVAAVRNAAPAPDVLAMEALKTISGLELFRKMIAGELPPAPITETMDFHLVEADKGRVVFQGHPSRGHCNPLGSIHGGWQATLLDSCMSCAVQSQLEAGQAYTTLEFKVNCLRALMPNTGPVRAEGRIIQVGRQIGIAEGRLTDAAGRIYAHGTTTCLIFNV